VLVGIPSEDRLMLPQSVARRKGLTLVWSRRMKHSYPRAIRLALGGGLRLQELVSHRFPLRRAAAAFALNSGYRDGVVKVMIQSDARRGRGRSGPVLRSRSGRRETSGQAGAPRRHLAAGAKR
jgi:hypothetical protein